MPRHVSHSTSRGLVKRNPTKLPRDISVAKCTLTSQQLDRWADLVAAGESPFPSGLADQDERQLVELVRRRRRARLVQFIARVIAREIWRMHEQ